MKRKIFLCSVLILFVGFSVYAQKKTASKVSVSKTTASNELTDVYLFQSFFTDAPIAQKAFGQGAFSYSDWDYASVITLGAMGGIPINDKIDVQGELHFASSSPEQGDGKSGLTDLDVYGHYNISKNKTSIASAGAMITLPIGSKDIGYNKLNYGVFGAYRTLLTNGMVITANAGLNFLESEKITTSGDFIDGITVKEETEHKASLRVGGGVIYPVNRQVHIVGELVLATKIKYTALSGGVDYAMKNGARLRGAIGLGLDDGAPDIFIMAGYLIQFK